MGQNQLNMLLDLLNIIIGIPFLRDRLADFFEANAIDALYSFPSDIPSNTTFTQRIV